MAYVICGVFILFDFITGLLKAFKKKEYTSTVMREGLYHKIGSILVVAFGCLVDYGQQFIDIGIHLPISLTVCAYIIIMEIGSIIENICLINPKIMSDKLKSYFKKLTDKGE